MKKLFTLFTFTLLTTTLLYASEPETGGASSPAESVNMSAVVRTQFTSNINDREPVDQITTLTNDNGGIYFFSEQRHMTGQIIKHRWEYNNKVMAEIEFGIGGPRWRVHSSKTLLPQWLGEWKVSVVDKGGKVIAEKTFMYTEANKTWQTD